ncbi:MAG: pyridoxal 5'-phosphate synthase glutaminase subunit PdxT [Candidatus Thermoplasmatota archaeon]
MRVGVVGLQGDVSEHVEAVRAAMRAGGFGGDVVVVRRREDLASVHALTLPGGESTAIGKLLDRSGLRADIVRRAGEGMPVLGTCAGCILLAKEGGGQVDRTNTPLLGLMDMAVDRNAFGRQRESFEADVAVDGLDRPFHAVFIRAPVITRTWGTCAPIAMLEGVAVMARQGHLWGSCFHPELSGDTRIHVAFLGQV